MKKDLNGVGTYLVAGVKPLLFSGSLALGIAASAVVIAPNAAVAQDAYSIKRVARDITVRIDGATQGSGVVLRKVGNTYSILTAWHVIDSNQNGEELSIQTYDGKQHNIKVELTKNIKRIGNTDLAEIKFISNKEYSTADIYTGNKLAAGGIMYAAGFPLGEQKFQFNAGNVVAHANIGIDQGYDILHSSTTNKGMSGGPLINQSGKIIGIHGRGERNEGNSDKRKTGINQGVPISYYLEFEKYGYISEKQTAGSSYDDYFALAANARRINQPQTVLRMTQKMKEIKPLKMDTYALMGMAYENLGKPLKSKEMQDYFSDLYLKYTNKIDLAINSGDDYKAKIQFLDELEEYTYIYASKAETYYLKTKAYSGNDNAKTITYGTQALMMLEGGQCFLAIPCKEEDINTFFVPGIQVLVAAAKAEIGDISGAFKLLEESKMNAGESIKPIVLLLDAEIFAIHAEPSLGEACDRIDPAIASMDEPDKLNISKRMRSLASLCSTRAEHNAKQVERLFKLIVLKHPVDYQTDIKPTFPETYEDAAEWGIPAGFSIYKNEGFVTLTMVDARRVMLYKPSIRKIGEWVSVYVASGDPDHGYLGKPKDPNKLTLVNCRSGEMIRAARERAPAEVSLSNSGNLIVTEQKDTVSMSVAIQEALKSDQKYTKHVNGWWMNDNMLRYFLLGDHDSLDLGHSQSLQATYDYICK